MDTNVTDYTYTIIIPHKNVPDLLRRCLDSIPQRDDVQVIVVDDDSSPEVVDFNHFPGSERNDVECCFTKEGKGAGYARNVGLKHARGKWLLFADADDFFVDSLFEKLDKWKDTDADIVYFKMSSVESTTGAESYRHVVYNGLMNQYISGNLSLKEYVKSVVIPTSKMLRNDFVTGNRLTYDEIVCGNDMGFAARSALCVNNISLSDEILYVLTVREDSLTRSSSLAENMKRMNVRLTNMKQLNENFMENGHPELCYEIRIWALEYSLSRHLGVRSAILFLYTAILLVRFRLHGSDAGRRSDAKSRYSFMRLMICILLTYMSFHFSKIFNPTK